MNLVPSRLWTSQLNFFVQPFKFAVQKRWNPNIITSTKITKRKFIWKIKSLENWIRFRGAILKFKLEKGEILQVTICGNSQSWNSPQRTRTPSILRQQRHIENIDAALWRERRKSDAVTTLGDAHVMRETGLDPVFEAGSEVDRLLELDEPVVAQQMTFGRNCAT